MLVLRTVLPALTAGSGLVLAPDTAAAVPAFESGALVFGEYELPELLDELRAALLFCPLLTWSAGVGDAFGLLPAPVGALVTLLLL